MLQVICIRLRPGRHGDSSRRSEEIVHPKLRLSVHDHIYCLVGLVVKASASSAEDPGLDSRLRRGDFFRVESYQ